MEEGSPPGATGYQGDYSARLADLVMEFASMDMSDQEFLRSLLPTAPGNVTPARHVSVASDVGFSPPVGSQNHNSGSQVGASSAQPIVPLLEICGPLMSLVWAKLIITDLTHP